MFFGVVVSSGIVPRCIQFESQLSYKWYPVYQLYWLNFGLWFSSDCLQMLRKCLTTGHDCLFSDP
jgi:hypothetical protein